MRFAALAIGLAFLIGAGALGLSDTVILSGSGLVGAFLGADTYRPTGQPKITA